MRILTGLILFVAAGLLFFTYTDSTYDAVQVLRADERVLDEAFRRLGLLEDRRDALLAEYSAIPAEDLEDLEKLLPDHVDNVRLIIDIDTIADEHDMTVRDIELTEVPVTQAEPVFVDESGVPLDGGGAFPDASTQTASLRSILLSFKVAGSYETFRAFLADLEDSLRLVDTESITFNVAVAEGGGGADFNDYELAIRTYWLE